MKRGKKRRRRHKINRCILKPTEEQLEAAYQAVMAWTKQHAFLIKNPENFWQNITDGHGVLSLYWPTFVSEEAAQFAFENGKGRVFAFQEDIYDYGEPLCIILDTYGLVRARARWRYCYRKWLRVERKYLRWVRRHF